MSIIVTMEQLETAADAALDYHMNKGQVAWQNDQTRPLLRDLMGASKPFPGGKEFLTERVAGEYDTTIEGFQYDDTVGYGNPAKLRTASYPYKLIHSGIGVSMHELIQNGISIANTTDGTGERRLGDRDAIVLADLLDYKVEDMVGGMTKGMDEMLWGDGSTDPKLVPGIRSIILTNPSAGLVVGGIDQAANTWWRNRAQTSIDASTPANGNLTNALQINLRQMRRYGSPKHKAYAGSAFLEALEKELRAKGTFTDRGWAQSGRIDMSTADIEFKGTAIDYAPTLDDLGLEKFCYFIDMKQIRLRHVDGENMKDHNPARPAEKYVLYRARTWVGGLTCRQRNTSGVFSIA